jgi:hypothetical protein
MAAALGIGPTSPLSGSASTCNSPAITPAASLRCWSKLAGFYTGHKVVLLWDGLSSLWSTRMQAYLHSQRDWLCAEQLPAYAPESYAVREAG